MKYGFYPGCSLHSTAKEYNSSTKGVAKNFGIELVEIKDWICCGATSGHTTFNYLSLALPAENMNSVKKDGLSELAVCCAACFNRLKVANHVISNEPDKKEKINEIIKSKYDGDIKVKHFLEILVKDYTLEKISEKILKKLNGLKVACYYGCLLVRPDKIMRFDDPENPMIMDNLISALGAEPVDWSFKTECCGASFSLTKTDSVLRLGNDILRGAKETEAECIAVACPLCQSNLDLRQKSIERKYNEKYNLPVFYFTQLVGLALGIDKKELGLEKLMINPEKLLHEKNII